MSTNSSMPHFLVTAGPTRERIDDVRDWGNIFSGQTGLDLAMAFLDLGTVTLLTSNETHAKEYDGYYGKAGMMGVETFKTHADLQGLLTERMTSGDRVDVVAMTAAVADYVPRGVYRVVKRGTLNVERETTEGKHETRNTKHETTGGAREIWEVEEVSAGKVKSVYEEIAVVGERTLKLVDQFRGVWGFKGVLIKFKLEVGLRDEELVRVAEASRVASGAELMVANTLAMARPSSGEGAAYMIDEGGARRVGRGELAGSVATWVRERAAPRARG